MRNLLTTTFLTLVIAVGTSNVFAQQNLKISTKEEVADSIRLVPCKNGDRFEAVKKIFVEMGAPDDAISSEKVKGMQNLVVTKRGKTAETVVVGAHYDKVADGCGAIDNWTGIVMLAHLYRTIRSGETNKTFVFVAFDSEESGLLGSAAFVRNIPKEKRADYCSMANFDSFGFGYPNILTNASSPTLTKAAQDLATELKMPLNLWTFAGADADSSSFQNNNIPAVTFDGLDAKWPQILHSSNDKVDKINTGSVFVGYNFGIRFLAKLDEADCSAFRKK